MKVLMFHVEDDGVDHDNTLSRSIFNGFGMSSKAAYECVIFTHQIHPLISMHVFMTYSGRYYELKQLQWITRNRIRFKELKIVRIEDSLISILSHAHQSSLPVNVCSLIIDIDLVTIFIHCN